MSRAAMGAHYPLFTGIPSNAVGESPQTVRNPSAIVWVEPPPLGLPPRFGVAVTLPYTGHARCSMAPNACALPSSVPNTRPC